MNLLNNMAKIFEKLFFKLLNLNDIESNIDKLKINQGKLLIKNLKDCDLDNLDNFAFSIYSQFNEDGIIQFLINNLDIKNKEFIEIGVENFKEANTRFLLQNNCWRGLIIDSSKANINFIKKQNYYWKYELEAEDAFVTKENVNKIVKKLSTARVEISTNQPSAKVSSREMLKVCGSAEPRKFLPLK